jgi:hypothetical protein
MFDEDRLTHLLAAHAETIPVPPAGIDALLARAPQAERTGIVRRLPRPSPRVAIGIAAAICVVAGLGAALAHDSGTSTPSFRDTAGAPASVTSPEAPSTTVATLQPDHAAQGGAAFLAPAPPSGSASQPSGAPPSSASKGTTTAPTDTARVIRTASLDLRVARHSFGSVVARVTTISASEGGFIADANTDESAATPSGSMTVRVPSARFNDTLGRLRALGKVETQSTKGQDVTGQYTDLNARLRAATATRDAYLTVLSRATNIGDILAVQDRIQGVQTTIDQLQGQINALDNRTTYATITLSVAEPGPKPKPVVKPHHKGGIEVAWDKARSGFARRIEGIISHSGSALVILVALLALAFALRLLIPRARRLLV